jgi:multidrug efflux pump
LSLAVGWFYVRLPSSFLPDEDQGYFITSIQLPVGATQERTVDVLKQVEAFYYLQQPEMAGMVDVAGFSFNGQGQNAALAFVHLKDWSQRRGAAHRVQAIIGRAFMALSQASRTPSFIPSIRRRFRTGHFRRISILNWRTRPASATPS